MENMKKAEDQKEFVEFTLKGANTESRTAYICMEKKQYDRIMPPAIDWSARVVDEGSRDERCCVDGHVWDLSGWEPVEEDWKYLDAGKCQVCGAVGHKGVSSAEVAEINDLRRVAKAQDGSSG